MRYLLLLILLGLAGLMGCTDEGIDNATSFNRKAMLENVADHIIIPSYEQLLVKVIAAESAINALMQNRVLSSLETAQQAWIEMYIAWQYANAFNFGPAGEQGLRKTLLEEIGTFPISEAKMANALNSGTYNLNDFNRDARGFLALEFMLFDLQNDQQITLNGLEDETRRQLTVDLILDIKTRVITVENEWKTQYRDVFVNNNGTDVGSSTSQLYNEFVKSFESIKNFKLGLPLGLRPGQLHPEPARVEAYYSGKSLDMMDAHLKAIVNLWHGKSLSGEDKVGFDDYLKSVVGGQALVDATLDQWELVHAAVDQIPQNQRLAVQITDSAQPLENLHEQLQRHTRFFKSDMSSLLGISITFSSGDGD